MKENVLSDFNYDVDYIENLQSQISSEIAKVVNKENSNRKYDFKSSLNFHEFSKLVHYNEILSQVVSCNDCFKDYDIKTIVSNTKNILNKV